jgi:hypothetical protein
MRGEGLQVEGLIGDPNPVVAVKDLWDPLRFDEVVVSTLPTDLSRQNATQFERAFESRCGASRYFAATQQPLSWLVPP